jgi:formate dehydrogenase subunit gamma
VLFGSGPWTRVLHPFFGVAMVLLFALLFGRAMRELLWRRHDTKWMLGLPRLFLTADDSAMPSAGRLNAGQKLVVWGFAASLATLLATGIVFWQPWFADYFPIPLRRIAVVLHAIGAVMLILCVMGHLYFAIWVRGSIRAMIRGTVSETWARQHHALWLAEERSRREGAQR